MTARILLVAPNDATVEDAMDKTEALRSMVHGQDVEIKIRWHGNKGILIKSSCYQQAADVAQIALENNIAWEQTIEPQ